MGELIRHVAVAVGAAVVFTSAILAPVAAKAIVGSALLPAGMTSAATAASPGNLAAVSAASATDAWAVGCKPGKFAIQCPGDGTDAALHWDGTSWRSVPVPMPVISTGPTEGQLNGVADISPTDAWAVGDDATTEDAQIIHWNGTTWKQVAVPSLGSPYFRQYELAGISALSATDVWAVGWGGNNQGLLFHYDGTSWKRVSSPNPGATFLSAVTATSATSAWAVGSDIGSCSCSKALILHWNGSSWKVAYNSLAASTMNLTSVAASSATNVWAGGWGYATADTTVTLQWNGTAWRRITSGQAIGASSIDAWGVATTSLASVWAVGGVYNYSILRYNGKTWKAQAVPKAPGSTSYLSGIAATSATNAWAVGYYVDNSTTSRFVLLRWNGKAWQRLIV